MDFRSSGKISNLEIPFTILHIYRNVGEESLYSDFKLRMCSLALNPAGDPARAVIASAKFDILLSSPNLNANIPCGAAAGDVFDFYRDLRVVYEEGRGRAELREHGRNSLTDISVSLEKNGKYYVRGYARDPDPNVDEEAFRGIEFCLVCGKSFISDSLDNFRDLFHELDRIQGDDRFCI